MTTMAFLLSCGLLSICLSCVMSASISTSYKVIDMSYPYIENATLSWPTMKGYKHEQVHWGPWGPHPGNTTVEFVGYYNFETAEHVGTHMDAPLHFYKPGQAIDEVPLANTFGEAVVINITAKAEQNPDYLVSVSDLEAWEKEHGRMPDKPIVFLHTGYGKYWPSWEKYFGSNTMNDTLSFHYPGLSGAAAKWLVTERNLKMYGVDVASLDAGIESIYFPVHVILSKQNIPAIENVANLHLLPPRGAEVFAAPMKMKDGTGGPTRLFARIGSKKDVSGGTSLTRSDTRIAAILLVAIFSLFMF